MRSIRGKVSCRVMGISYEIVCVPCMGMPSPGRYRYIGETDRNAYTRGREHFSMLKIRNKASILWEHCKDVHSDNMVDFKMSAKGYKNDVMMKKIMEAIIIGNSEQGPLLNTKQEWNFVSFPRIIAGDQDDCFC